MVSCAFVVPEKAVDDLLLPWEELPSLDVVRHINEVPLLPPLSLPLLQLLLSSSMSLLPSPWFDEESLPLLPLLLLPPLPLLQTPFSTLIDDIFHEKLLSDSALSDSLGGGGDPPSVFCLLVLYLVSQMGFPLRCCY